MSRPRAALAAALTAITVVFGLSACGAGSRPVHGRVAFKDHQAAHTVWTTEPRTRRTCTTSSSRFGKKTRTRRTCRTVPAGSRHVAHRTAECWELHLTDGRHLCVSYGRWHSVHAGDRI